ncbi:MAG TPA: TolC family protein [Candidatus Acidoferrum sp.]
MARPLLAVILAATLVGGPVSPAYAQDTAQNPPPAPAPQAKTSSTVTTPIALGTAKYHFSRAPRPFPNLFAPYRAVKVPPSPVVNSPRIEQLIHDNKLELSLQDAVELALENSVDIAVQRYYPWIADVGILKASSGASGYGTPGAAIAGSSASLNPFAFVITSYDPLLTTSVSFDDRKTPINNPFISGTGTSATAASIVSHTATYNTQYSEYFPTGTSMTVTYDNTRSSNSAAANFFNPAVQSSIFLGISQNLLSGFGLTVNRRNIIIASNNRKIADLAFAQQAITTTTNTITAYWELVYARANVTVEQQAVAVSEKLFNDNKKQLEIGTMAPLDVTRAEAQLATDRQNLIVAQTVQLQDEQTLKNAITRNPLDPRIINLEIIPTDKPSAPEQTEAPSFEEALKEAYAKRPDLLEQEYNLKNAALDVKATHNALLPTATLSGQYGTVGLAGNSRQTLTSQTILGTQLVDSTGAPINAFIPLSVPVTTRTNFAGWGDAMSSVFHNNNPDYAAQISITIPIRNRSLQADNQRSQLVQRQIEMEVQQLKNAALLDVRNTYIKLEQDRARVEAASKASELQRQTFEAEQKKYQLGASTVYQVILTQRDYVAAQGTELRALADLVEDRANYERAVGKTLEVNHVTIADALGGAVERETLIPGTLHGQVVGMDKLFSNGGQK